MNTHGETLPTFAPDEAGTIGGKVVGIEDVSAGRRGVVASVVGAGGVGTLGDGTSGAGRGVVAQVGIGAGGEGFSGDGISGAGGAGGATTGEATDTSVLMDKILQVIVTYSQLPEERSKAASQREVQEIEG